MDFYEMVRTNNTCRYYKPDPVPPDVLARVVDAARWAPSGGNRQPLRFIVVRDRAKKLEMRNLYLPIWDEYIKVRMANAPRSALLEAADHFARHMEDIPVFVLALARLADVHPTDTQLGRLSIVGGASVYPAVQNMLLAARHEGLGTALTTLHVAEEPKLKEMFDIPEEISVAAVVMMGWPVKPFPQNLRRAPLSGMLFDGKYGTPFPGA